MQSSPFSGDNIENDVLGTICLVDTVRSRHDNSVGGSGQSKQHKMNIQYCPYGSIAIIQSDEFVVQLS